MTAEDLPPRTLFIGLSAAGHGGIQGFNRRVIGGLARIGGNAPALMLSDDAPVAGAIGFGNRRLRFARAIMARAGTADLLLLGHINLLPFALLYRLLRPRGAVVLFAHGIEVWGDPAYRGARGWESTVLRRVVDRIAIVSRYSRTLMAGAFALPDDRFVLFPNAVDVTPPAPRGMGGATILAVTRLGVGEREKHVDKLIRALPLVACDVPDVRLLVIGEGSLRPELRTLSEELGVGARVDMPGAVDGRALARAYADAAIFALPSSKEGFGIVYLEAWVNGLAVLGSRFGAAGEVIADGVDGLTVDPDDVPALAAALIALLQNRNTAVRMGAAGRAKVERLYSGAAFVANLRALLSEVARGRRTGR